MASYGFWGVAGLLAFAVAVYLLRAMARAQMGEVAGPADKALALYRSQLGEIDRDVAKGTLDAAEADRLRTEVQRRILEAGRMQSNAQTISTRWGQNLGLAAVLAALFGALATYIWLGAPDYGDLPLSKRLAVAEAAYQNRPTQAEAEAAAPAAPALEVDPEFTALIEKLRAAVAQRPNDIQGLTLLARNEAQLGNFAAAARAYDALIAAKGDLAGADDHLGAAQAMIAAAGGIVTPEAEAALMQALQIDPASGLARYFSGLLFAQIGRPDRAFSLWEPLLRDSPEGAPWEGAIRALLPEVAAAAGINYTLPDVARGVADALAGPSAQDMQNAAEMTEDERRVMINTMVTGLEERLLSQGGSAEEWVRLVSSLATLGEAARAKVAFAAGAAALASDPAGLQLLQNAAGVTP
ncbi:MAG: c-type cytochrome biogenesis protein CcmI [Cypionkella sp.]|nr:c-type cytochrome biogenesis protein CcmI [Cypionkella sp.]